MSKRKFDDMADMPDNQPLKNSLDSDEDDDEVNEANYNVMNEDEFEGTEDGPSAPEANVGFTAFNMKEELEEGHFDKDGHYLWKKEKQIRDNWLDNIDWVQIKPSSATDVQKSTKSGENHGLGDSGSSDDEGDIMFDPIPLYRQILEYLKPGETVSRTLCRLGKGKKKLTTAERWKKKKESKTREEEEDPNSVNITKLTELANELLTRTGNMDIYQESYEQIKKKIEQADKRAHPSKQEAELDMYADDFDEKEKAKLDDTDDGNLAEPSNAEESTPEENVTWDLKWSQNDNAEIHGPHTSQQMHAWAKEGYFKKGAWVRRTGQQNQFYNASRVDFELYL
ncbi:PREDICTED: CD2 antigen cytoplasmic tail-binding protein 2 homolog isoform X1 [Wasmannia auropunctata]|uniref:CD2 antigen cytoplasmic tail-binding protein 2 homolog isoform X1 n=1 Tax=Wasmannia auropunctata TaxID=64793 RepID=UPI0005EDB705|nr:PREDICTED: CD2 antigen cytoplasmic tail-binding protein 2 homolog isoform X1 [Wasmannia auropunctata]